MKAIRKQFVHGKVLAPKHEAHVVEDKNSHKLRHYRMGHMSEIGLGELSKRGQDLFPC